VENFSGKKSPTKAIPSRNRTASLLLRSRKAASWQTLHTPQLLPSCWREESAQEPSRKMPRRRFEGVPQASAPCIRFWNIGVALHIPGVGQIGQELNHYRVLAAGRLGCEGVDDPSPA